MFKIGKNYLFLFLHKNRIKVELQLISFIILGIVAIASALSTVLNRHPIYSAMSLVVHFFALAGLYLTLHSQFIAVLQILVYAGAIMVLVIFVIMLLNLNEEEKRKLVVQSRHSFGILVVAIFAIMLVVYLTSGSFHYLNEGDSHNLFTAKALGDLLFKQHLAAFEVVGILLLAAIIGAMVMAKKKLVD